MLSDHLVCRAGGRAGGSSTFDISLTLISRSWADYRDHGPGPDCLCIIGITARPFKLKGPIAPIYRAIDILYLASASLRAASGGILPTGQHL